MESWGFFLFCFEWEEAIGCCAGMDETSFLRRKQREGNGCRGKPASYGGTGLGKIVVVAEKPSVGRDIARVIGCRDRGEGCLIGDQYIVTWAVGHLGPLMEPDELDE